MIRLDLISNLFHFTFLSVPNGNSPSLPLIPFFEELNKKLQRQPLAKKSRSSCFEYTNEARQCTFNYKFLLIRNPVPWLQVYVGQSDSIYLLLKALNVSSGNIDHLRVAGRLVIEMYRVPSSKIPASTPYSVNLRFLLDGVDISESLKVINLCEGDPLVCSAEKLVNFIKSSKFWGPKLESHPLSSSSEEAFKFICHSED